MDSILIADDSAELLEMIRAIYCRRSLSISKASSRNEIFSMISQVKPDLVLLDVHLGEEDGRGICKELKEMDEYKQMPIILMSGDHEKLTNHHEVLADDILEKPFRIETILSKIKAVTANNKRVLS